MNEELFQKISRGMNLRMGTVMSVILCFVGNMATGYFSIVGYFVSLVVCLLISLVLGYFVPIGKLQMKACMKLKLTPTTFMWKYVCGLVSGIIHIPILTFTMVGIAYAMAIKQTGGLGAISFIRVFVISFVVCFITGQVIDYIFMPIFLMNQYRKYGIKVPPVDRKKIFW